MRALRISRITGALIIALGLSSPVMANTTSSGVKGQVVGPNGNAAVGTVVTITHIPSGTTKTAIVNDSGSFAAKGLRVGGPYKIIIDSDEFEDTEIKDVFLTLGETYPVNVALNPQEDIETIVVTGRIVNKNYGSNSPSSNFNLKDIEMTPTVNRDIKDVIRVDPRIYINQSSSHGDSIVCAGGNPRFNSLTVDGARMNDNFGLNSNGYPTVRIPFSYDAIDQVAVELAPFDVQYGGFTSCNINAVTKSGGNEVHGSVFMDYTSDSLKGNSLEGDSIDLGSYDEKRYGFNVGFPLIEDKLFFFAAYEKLDGSQIMQYTAMDNGDVVQSDIDRIIQISKDIYEYDPGTMVPSIPVEDEKLLIKLDWNIDENHRLNFVYNYNDGFEIGQSDASDPDEISLSNHFYERGAEFTSIVSSLYSDWSDNFSTEVRIGYSKLDNRQISLDQTSGFGEFRIERIGANGNVNVFLGPDDSRQANKLKYDTLAFKLAGTYYLDNHELYFGFEREELDVFNLFVQHNETETRFNNLEDFESGLADDVYYGNANSHNPDDAAGEFKYALNTLYFQDKFELDDYDVTITAGLRYDLYTSSDTPTHNQNFEDRYGYSNAQNLDGVDLLQPRFGFNWTASDQLEVRGGFGLYSGGNPNVWISNSYSNDGVRNIQSSIKDVQILGPDAIEYNGSGRPGYDIPQSLYDEIGSGSSDSSTNVTDPNFEIPSEWKYALGLTYVTESEYVLMADLLYTDKQDAAVVQNLAFGQTGAAPDGRPVYSGVNHGRDDDFLLTNVKGNSGDTTVVSFVVSKEYDNGLAFSTSYAYTDANDVHPMTSSVAFSNYHGVAAVDSENPGVATSNYEVPHRFTVNVTYVHEFFDGYETQFSVFGQANQTNPYSYNFDKRSGGFGRYHDAHTELLYVPTENDPLVVYGQDGDGNPFDETAFNDFIASEGLTRGQIMDRNELDGSWWTKFDIRIEQQFPGFISGHKASAYLVIENFGNMLSDNWGVLKQGSFLQSAVESSITEDGKYSYDSYTNPTPQSRTTDASLWEIRLGVKYDF